VHILIVIVVICVAISMNRRASLCIRSSLVEQSSLGL